MAYKAEDFPDHPGLAETLNEWSRQERKQEMKRERNEYLYGSDSAVWHTIDENGNRVSEKEWFIRMPNDTPSGQVVQAQHNLFAIISERRKHPFGSQRWEELTIKIDEWNEKIEWLQEKLLYEAPSDGQEEES